MAEIKSALSPYKPCDNLVSTLPLSNILALHEKLCGDGGIESTETWSLNLESL